LTPQEIDQVRQAGLKPLSSTLLKDRLDRAMNQGYFSQEIAELLWSEPQAEDRGRVGMTWFVNCRSVLQDEHSVIRLFQSWGGEALYNSHEHRPDTGNALREFGLACIVVAAVPMAKAHTLMASKGERFIWRHLQDRGVATGHGADVETYATEPVGPDSILEIVTADNPRFAQVTQCASWSARRAE
jgi:hypothetical protein